MTGTARRRPNSNAKRSGPFAVATLAGAVVGLALWHTARPSIERSGSRPVPPDEERPKHQREHLALTPGARATAKGDTLPLDPAAAAPRSRRIDADRKGPARTELGEPGQRQADFDSLPADAGLPIELPSHVDSTPSDDSIREPKALPADPTISVDTEPPDDRAEKHETALPSRARQVMLSAFQALRQPGLCNDPGDAIEARQQLMQHFRHGEWASESLLYIDPRLPLGTESALGAHLDYAEQEASTVLRAQAPRPEVFAYLDTELLLAASCTNDDVVAYYDGALHVVPSHADIRQSVVHEYTHHVLFSRGFVGPTWAREGVAMYVARETWWLSREWLARVEATPFALEDMEQAIPYKMRPDQALLFYVQSAAMVACAVAGEAGGIAGFVSSMHGERHGDELNYDLPEFAHPSEWRACIDSLRR